jgi:hypothetical protein
MTIKSAEAEEDQASLPHGSTAPWRGRAFGVDLELRLELPPLAALEPSGQAAETLIDLAEPRVFEDLWPTSGARQCGLMTEAEAVLLEVFEHPESGYLLSSPLGRYIVSPDGSGVVCCASPALWDVQRMLIGQVLPLVAALRGLDVLHASAVAVDGGAGGDGGAVAFTGPPGAGKSTLAVNLALRGAALLADDVIALRRIGERLRVEPATSLVNLRRDQGERLRARLGGLGRPLGSTEKLHIAMDALAEPQPLRALYVLELGVSGPTEIAPIAPPDPRIPLGSTYLPYLSAPRLVDARFESAALMERSVDMFRVRVGRTCTPDELADRVMLHVRGLPAQTP